MCCYLLQCYDLFGLPVDYRARHGRDCMVVRL